ncbi:DNA-processing protein DprA [Alcaligenes aquatilis]
MSVVSPATLTLLTLSMLKGVGPAALKKVAAISGFDDLSIEALAASIPAIGKALIEPDAWIRAQEAAAKQIEEAQRHDARILSAVDGEYPLLLAATKDDPFILFVKGTLSQLPDRSVAIIGTREPTMHGKRIAKSIASFFVEQKWSIVSGLAVGCDAMAHQSTLDAGGHTVAVLAHGLQMIAPAQHKKLAEQILASGGALISEYPFGQTVRRQQYVKRDRTQAGLAQGVVMIQSDVKGGSLYASRASLDYDRWLAVPYPTEKDRERAGPKIQANLLIADGKDEQRMDLLWCSSPKLKKIIVLHSRDDYFQLLESMQGTSCEPRLERPNDKPYTTPSALCGEDLIHENGGESIESEPPRGALGNREAALVTKENTLISGPVFRQLLIEKDWLVGLSIQQMPSEDSQDFKKLITKLCDVDLFVEFSARLRYMQKQLELLISLYVDTNAATIKERQLMAQFAVEAILKHMQRAIKSLADLVKNDHSLQHDAGAIQTKDRQDVPQQFELGYVPMLEEQSGLMFGVLDEFLGTLLQPLRFAEKCDGTQRVSGDRDLRFDDLVMEFNVLIARGLHV